MTAPKVMMSDRFRVPDLWATRLREQHVSPAKKDDALRLGAHEVVISRHADAMNKHVGSFDFILDAVAATHDINAYLKAE